MIIFHIVNVIKGADFGSGFRRSRLGVGGSVANASAAKVSIIKLTHSNWTAVRTELSSPLATAETNVITTAVMLTVIWNCSVLARFEGAKHIYAYLKKLLDSVVDSSSPGDGLDNGCEVIIHQNDC